MSARGDGLPGFHSRFSFKVMVDRVLIGRETAVLPWILALMAAAAVAVSLIGSVGITRLLTSSPMRWARCANGCSHTSSGCRWATSGRRAAARPSIVSPATSVRSRTHWRRRFRGPFSQGLNVVANASLLFALDPVLALVASLVFPLSLVGPRWLTARTTTASHQRKVQESRALAIVQENVVSQSVVKAFGLGRHAESLFGASNRRLVECSVRVGFLGALVERSATVSIYLLQVVVLGAGAWRAMNEQMSVGNSSPSNLSSSP